MLVCMTRTKSANVIFFDDATFNWCVWRRAFKVCQCSSVVQTDGASKCECNWWCYIYCCAVQHDMCACWISRDSLPIFASAPSIRRPPRLAFLTPAANATHLSKLFINTIYGHHHRLHLRSRLIKFCSFCAANFGAQIHSNVVLDTVGMYCA